MASQWQYGLLGDLSVCVDGGAVTIAGRRQRALLALLLLRANQVVSQEELVEELWGERHVDQTGRRSVKVAVWRLRGSLRGDGPNARTNEPRGGRSHLPDDPIITSKRGYRLQLNDGALDVLEFERELAAGRRLLASREPARALVQLRNSLARWRGAALGEFLEHLWARDEALRLEELRGEALEARIAAELELGEHARLVGELKALVAAYPERERLQASLMLALYRSGRQVEALAAFRSARRHLVGNYGVEPGAELHRLHAAILAHAPELHEPSGVGSGVAGDAPSGSRPRQVSGIPLAPRLCVPADTPFVGRERERAVLAESLALAEAGTLQAVFLSGEPGIGKTRIVSDLASDLHARGLLVSGGRCDHVLSVAYQPFVETVDHLLTHAPAELIERQLAQHGATLSRFIQRLDVSPDLGSQPSSGSDSQYRLFAALGDLFAALGQQTPLVLVLEDLHWADAATVLLLRYVLTMPNAAALMVLCTYRSTDLASGTPLAGLLADLHREPTVREVEVAGLNEAEVLELVEVEAGARLGEELHRVAARVHRDCGGNPFFLTQLLRGDRLADLTASSAAGLQNAAALPTSLRDTIARRIAALGPHASDVLEAAAVAGDNFELTVLRRVLEMDETEVLAVVDAGLTAQLLVQLPGPGVRLEFVHALVPQVLRGQLSSERRRRLHRHVAQAIAELYGEDGGSQIAALAHHWREGCEPPDVETAVRCARLAAQRSLVQFAPEDAISFYEDALALHALSLKPASNERCELQIGLGEAQRHAGQKSFRETLLEAARLADRLGDGDRLVRAALANTRGFTSATGDIDTERLAMLQAALQSIGPMDSPDRARLLAAQAVELAFSHERETPRALSDEALVIARRVGDRRACAEVLTTRFFAIWTPDTLAERLANSAENVALCDRLGDALLQSHALHWRAAACLEAGDTSEARSCVARERELADRLRQPAALWLAAYNDVNLAIVRGQLARGDELVSRALELGVRSGQSDAGAVFAAQLACLRFDQGRLGELEPLLVKVLDEHPGITGFRAVLALAYCEQGDLVRARQAIAHDASTDFRGLAYDVTWLSVACIYAHVVARLGDQAPARALYSLLEPWREQVAVSVVAWGSVAHYLGVLATALGEHAAAANHFENAALVHVRMQAPVWIARTQLETARMLSARSEGNSPRAQELAEATAGTAHELGCATLERDALAMLRGATGEQTPVGAR